MRRHIVSAFERMLVVMRPIGNDFPKMAFQIAAHFRAYIFVDGQ